MKIHFIGIGGIGISALARHFIGQGKEVTGSDLIENETTEDLRKLGAEIYKGHRKKLPQGVQTIIYSPAVTEDNPEMVEAKRLNLEILSYPEALGKLTEKYFTIAVSGTHGKSTTTAMTALCIEDLDPTVIVGTKMKEFENTNYKKGQSNYLLIEADEWQGSLLNYTPDVVVLTNLEEEHLDCYRDLNHLIATFGKYLSNLKEGGKIIYNEEDSNLGKLKISSGISFSKDDSIASDVKKVLRVPGDHNLENGLAAIKVAETLGIDTGSALEKLSQFKGSWRRFEEKDIKINGKDHKIILDYAHHPTELKAVLNAVSEKFPTSAFAVFQPHQYQRTLHLEDRFVDVFNESPIDLFVTDIYSVPGREKEWIKRKIDSQKLVSRSKNKKTKYIPGDLETVAEEIKSNLQGDEIIVIIGAGDVYRLEEALKGPKNNFK